MNVVFTPIVGSSPRYAHTCRIYTLLDLVLPHSGTWSHVRDHTFVWEHRVCQGHWPRSEVWDHSSLWPWALAGDKLCNWVSLLCCHLVTTHKYFICGSSDQGDLWVIPWVICITPTTLHQVWLWIQVQVCMCVKECSSVRRNPVLPQVTGSN